MKLKEALQTAARRYLIERLDALVPTPTERQSRAASALQAWLETPVVRDAIGRHREVQDLLVRVERATPHPPGSAAAVREWLVAAVHEPPFSGPIDRHGARGRVSGFVSPPTEESLAWRADESNRFCEHLDAVFREGPLSGLPLPYRRSMSDREREEIEAGLAQRWPPDFNAWYPGGQPPTPADLVFLSRDFVSSPAVLEQLRRALAGSGATRLWELPQDPFQPAREMDLELFNPARPLGFDVFWTSPAMDWLILGSHECLTTLAGDELVADFKRRVPGWQEGEWRPPWSA